jgi:hypothetical protein
VSSSIGLLVSEPEPLDKRAGGMGIPIELYNMLPELPIWVMIFGSFQNGNYMITGSSGFETHRF